MKQKIKKLVQEIGVMSLSLTIAFLLFMGVAIVRGWSEPTVAPPGGNVGAPINTSVTQQTKDGGLVIANGSGITTGLIVKNGNVGIGTTTPSQKLDVAGYVKGQTGLCIGADCRTSWPTAGSSGITSLSAGTGIVLSPNPITSTGTISASTPPTPSLVTRIVTGTPVTAYRANATSVADCAADEKVVGGGVECTGLNWNFAKNTYPSSTTQWTGACLQDGSNDVNVTAKAYAICAKIQ